MSKKKIESEQELKRIEINLDKHTYDYLKSKRINISKMVRQLLRVALFSGSTDYIHNTDYTNSLPLGKDEVGGSNPLWSCITQVSVLLIPFLNVLSNTI